MAAVLTMLAGGDPSFDAHFGLLSDRLFEGEAEDAETERREVRAIREMTTLTPFQTFVELIALERTKYYRAHLIYQLDSLFMKNADTGLMAQGKSARNQRRWRMGSRLLEVLVQLAVLEPAAPAWPEATIDDLAAFNGNLRDLKRRLREIGFYVDLSDAYNAQQIRPRYAVAAANETSPA